MYNKTTWINGITPLNASNMNKIEDGIKQIDNKIEETSRIVIYSEDEIITTNK